MRTHEFTTAGDHWCGSIGTTRQEEVHGRPSQSTLTEADQAAGVTTEEDRPRGSRLRTIYYAGGPLLFSTR